MKRNCDRCGGKTEQVNFTFSEVNEHNETHQFGIFCTKCTTELLDELRGKLEWFRIERSWKGYIHPEARPELEQSGFIRPKHRSQHIEVKQAGRTHDKIERTDAIAILRVEYAGGLIPKEKFEKALRAIKDGNCSGAR